MPADILIAFGWPALVGAAVGYGVILADRRVARARVKSWRSVAERLGLREVESTIAFFGTPELSARAGRRRVRFERHKQGKHSSFTEITVAGNSGVTLRPEVRAHTLELPREREIELGDEVFDREVEVHGYSERVRAILDAETRGIVLNMLNGRLPGPGRSPVTIPGSVTLVDGNLRAVLGEQPTPPTPPELADALGALLALADRFQGPVDVAARLAAAIEHEPLWRVRLQGLQLLSIGYPNDPATVAALRHALADERAEVQLQAASALGAEGQQTLLEIAGRERVDDATAAHAVFALGKRLTAEAGVSILRQALRRRRLQTGSACIDALGQLGGATVVGLLVKVLSLESGPLAVATAKALGKTATPEVEEALLHALARGVPDLRLPVIEALGHTASVRAVPQIREVAAQPDADAEVRRAARQAVAEIQSRLPGASPGQLSIAEGEAGQLSLADDDPRGRVSLPEGS